MKLVNAHKEQATVSKTFTAFFPYCRHLPFYTSVCNTEGIFTAHCTADNITAAKRLMMLCPI